MKKTALAILLSLCLSSGAQAATGKCYTAKEFEAEQGIRIHSELMVIGLTCMRMPQGGSQLYSKYQNFTQKNKGLIAGYEKDILSYYRRTGAANPETALHTFRTSMANQISQHAIAMSTVSFCKRFSPRMDQALAMDSQKIRRWAQRPWDGSPTSRPVCSGS